MKLNYRLTFAFFFIVLSLLFLTLILYRSSHVGLHAGVHRLQRSQDIQRLQRSQDIQRLPRAQGIVGKAVAPARATLILNTTTKHTLNEDGSVQGLFFTHDDWPNFFQSPFNFSIPSSPYNPPFDIQWDFNTSVFLQHPDVKGKPPKIITWMAPVGYLPNIPQPVRMRTCPEMPCRLTTNREYGAESAALLWNAQAIRDRKPPARASSDQVYVFHNVERLEPMLVKSMRTYLRRAPWRSAFNWTMSFRSDSDILDPYGYVYERDSPPPAKDYDAILAAKSGMAVWLVGHCTTHSRREKFVKVLQQYVQVDVYGACGHFKCARDNDAACFAQMSSAYKFYLALENSLCPDYFTEKVFRYFEADSVLVVRGGEGIQNVLPPGTYVNVNDFETVEDLADHLLYLDENPQAYLAILRAKDRYQVLYEEYPHRKENGVVTFVHYHYEAVPLCELCRRLWHLDAYKKSIPDILDWSDRGNCLPPRDV